jgi:dihydrodipicolinate synthase/N-acetylneuraminate lyase
MTKDQRPRTLPLPRGIVPVVQTPFDARGEIDFASLHRLVDDALAAGAAGFLAPVVASEVACLSCAERTQIVREVASHVAGRVPLIVGASFDDPHACRDMGAFAEELTAAAWLVAVPQACYQQPAKVVPFFREVACGVSLPLVIQDLQFGGPGLPLHVVDELRSALPTLAGLKIETVPAGPKYTAVRELCGPEFYIAGGWAVPQLIEALDRGVDAMVPESSMVRVYRAVYRLYAEGQRDAAQRLFRDLLPVLVFTNQELAVSVAFFKRLLVRKGIFARETMRLGGFAWDPFNLRIADELIEHYLDLERRCAELVDGPNRA